MELSTADSLCMYWEKIAIKNDSLYLVERQKFYQLTGVNNSLEEELKKEKKKSRKICIGVGVGGTLLGIMLGVLLGK